MILLSKNVKRYTKVIEENKILNKMKERLLVIKEICCGNPFRYHACLTKYNFSLPLVKMFTYKTASESHFIIFNLYIYPYLNINLFMYIILH